VTRGRLITFEGVEGCGKSTQVDLLAARLRRKGLAVVTTREPGGTRLGEGLRALLLDPAYRPTPLAELLMLEAARAQLVADVVRPALEAGSFVLADRFADSSVAYQGEARELGAELVDRLNALACNGVWPDRTIVLDLSPLEALERARRRPSTTGDNRRFEDEELAFHSAVAGAYRRLVERDPERVRLVSASGTPTEVHGSVLTALESVID
jgi:dTMP kinase